MRGKTAAWLGLALAALTGCAGHGGDSFHRVDTGSPAGELRAVQITPPPGTVYVTDGTGFRVAWPPDAPPPATFDIELFRYREGYEYDYEDRDGVRQEVEVERRIEGADSRVERQSAEPFTWILDPDDDLADGGVYFLRLRSGPDEVRAAFIVSGDRAVPTRSSPSSRHTVPGR